MIDRKDIAPRFYIDDHAVLFGLLLRQAEQLAGTAGVEASDKATILYGRERGLRMAMRCAADGRPLTPRNYLNYGEWVDDRQWSQFQPSGLRPFGLQVPVCGWNTSWEKYGLQKYGKVYCAWIDQELVRAFNPENSLQLDSILSHGAARCLFAFTGADYADEEDFTRDVALRTGMREKNLKDFLYHTGHILSALRRTYLLELGLIKGEEIVTRALAEYASLFGDDKAEAVVAESKQDFLTI